MDKTFKAFRLFDEGGKVAARFVEMKPEELDAGAVTIRVQYSCINYKDALAATGAGKIVRRFPMVGGIDLAGTVISSDEPRFRAGQSVAVTGYGLGVTHNGGYAECARVPADWVQVLPNGYSTFDAMAIGTAGVTAVLGILAMETNGLTPANGPVIVTGASGGVGSIAVDILAGLGYEVAALTGKPTEHALLRELGATQILDRHEIKLGSRPLEAETWAGAVDNLGGDWLAWLTRTMKSRGCIASIGLAAGTELHTTVMPFILRNVSLLGISSSPMPVSLREEVWRRLSTDMRPRHLARLVRTVEFTELAQAFPAYLEGRVTGRAVVRIGA